MENERRRIRTLRLGGYTSLSREIQAIEFEPVTLIIGSNASGKSNVVSFFKMLSYMTTQALQRYIGEEGGTERLLHFGPKKTKVVTAELDIEWGECCDTYKFELAHAAGDTFIFTNEELVEKNEKTGREKQHSFDAGHKESKLFGDEGKPFGNTRIYFQRCQVFHFHDTSKEAKIRNSGYIEDVKYFRRDGGNLAAFLLQMKEHKPEYYNRIVERIRVIFPQFDTFVLEPSTYNKDYIMLNWRAKGADYLFSPAQLSDGSLRFMALTTLLLQPQETLPTLIVLDEPELGLHPTALTALAGMIRHAAERTQVIIATQSPALLDEFEPENVVVCEYDTQENRSTYQKREREQLDAWLDKYSMGELWDKNVLGGRP